MAKHLDFEDRIDFPTPAYSIVGWAMLAVAFVLAITVQIGVRVYALFGGRK